MPTGREVRLAEIMLIRPAVLKFLCTMLVIIATSRDL
jgi:hypothetical protein